VYLQAFILQWTNVNKAPLLDVKRNFSELLLSVAGDPKMEILIKLVLWHDITAQGSIDISQATGNLLYCNTTLSGNSGVVFCKVNTGVIFWKQASRTPPCVSEFINAYLLLEPINFPSQCLTSK